MPCVAACRRAGSGPEFVRRAGLRAARTAVFDLAAHGARRWRSATPSRTAAPAAASAAASQVAEAIEVFCKREIAAMR